MVLLAACGGGTKSDILAPTKDDANFRIFANGTAVVIEEDSEGTKMYAASDLTTALFGGMDVGNYFIYGGWTTGSKTGNTSVTANSGTFLKTIYGGSRQGTLNGNTNVTVKDGSFTWIYGGGWEATINGDTSVTVNDGEIACAVFGGGNTINSIVTGTTHVLITDVRNEIPLVCGGSYKGMVGSTDVNITGGKITTLYGDCEMNEYTDGELTKESVVNGDTSITVSGTAEVYWLCGANCTVMGSTFIVIDGMAVVNYILGTGAYADLPGSSNITIKGGTIGGDPEGFGFSICGAFLTSAESINITIEGGQILDDVYGVCKDLGSIESDVIITIYPEAIIDGDVMIAADGETAGAGSEIIRL